ncbi:MAG TPA: YbiU family protein [Ilumatobacter sp.]|nr:YbiU family protein [Ilumatobacter sp.]
MEAGLLEAAPTPAELLARLGIDTDHVATLLVDLQAAMQRRVAEISEQERAGEPVFPIVDFADVLAGRVTDNARDAIRNAGCAVLRGTFARAEAEAWDAEVAEYVAQNAVRERFLEKHPGAADAARIWPVYWSRPQVAARQHSRMATARRFLNGLWIFESPTMRWFEPDHDIGYPDRVRRREPGALSKGLPAHADSPSVGGWRVAENQAVFAPLLTGGIAAYDPFDAAYRTGARIESPVPCTVFRTFQGWTALSEMHPDDGVLHVVPIPAAVGYRLVHGLAAELGLLGAPVAAPRRDAADEMLLAGLVPVPAVEPGDTVWWHGDLYHSVGDAANDSRWGNVMYIGVSPRCPRNEVYAATMLDRFQRGASPVDFAADDLEVDVVGRATIEDLNALGRAQFGLESTKRD